MRRIEFDGPDCDPSRLQLFLSGILSAEAEAELTRHLDSCSRCQEMLDLLAAPAELKASLRCVAGEAGLVESLARCAESSWMLGQAEGPIAEGEESTFLDPPGEPGDLGRFEGYRVLGLRGRGGMGLVFEAFDPALDRQAAIKVLTPPLSGSAMARLRFQREAKAAASVVHENVVGIYSVSVWKGLPYIVMQFVRGISLQERLNMEGCLGWAVALRCGVETAAGLTAAHARGIVHRDVKPSNILIEEGTGRFKLTDFGLARTIDGTSLTLDTVVGTPQYMSPEQVRGEAIDGRSDIFSLGCVLYACCTGHSPFRAANTAAVLKRVCEGEPAPLHLTNPDVPRRLADAINRMLAKDPSDRYASMEEVGRTLAACEVVTAPAIATAVVPPTLARPRPKRTRPKWRGLLVSGLVLVIVALVTAQIVGGGAPNHDAGPAAAGPGPAEAEGECYLTVNIQDQSVKVTIDADEGDIIEGAAQHSRTLKPGRHTIRVARKGADDIVEPLEIEAACLVRVEATAEGLRIPKAGSLLLEISDPQARVRIDGRPKVIEGAAQHQIPLGSGEHTLRISRPEVDDSVEVIRIPRVGSRIVRVGFR